MVRGMRVRTSDPSVVLAHLLPAFLDFFGLLLIHAGEFVARLAHYMQHLDSDHIRKYAAELCRMAVFGTLNPLTPARLQA